MRPRQGEEAQLLPTYQTYESTFGPGVKRRVKRICYFFARGLVLPLAVTERAARRVCRRDVWFATHSEGLSFLPGRVGYFIRNAYYNLTLRRCPLDCCFLFGTLFTHSETEIGERVYMGAHCIVGLATIDDDTMLADHVYILSGKNQHGTADPALRFQDQPGRLTCVHIGRNSWVGTNTVIMADIGQNCVIGAGSVVTKPIPDNSVAVGNPARVIRTMFSVPAAKSG